ncbi:putative endonuclease V [Crocosphaera subtropica ATCC 51142]|uniref:Endonuclease V n=1 Tax=Crocosphaera subtropica (strain ATCC 51142 / BH68) TaxID=43989 RepID=B1WVB8_CROS5|nr:putative endonuclease V [Crocosphaera subtropica ATCC 51142]
MKINEKYLHPTSLDEAKIIQQQLKKQVITKDQLQTVKYVAGVDVGNLIQRIYNKQQQQRPPFLYTVILYLNTFLYLYGVKCL